MTDQKEQPNATNAVCDTPKHWPGVLVAAREEVLKEVCSLFGRAAVGVYGNRQLALLRPLVRAWDAYAAALGGFRRG